MARILVCDDDPGIRDLLVVTLELDHEVETAENGRVALEALDEDPDIDAIVLDVMMPELDGYATLEQIRARPRLADVVVVMLSARVGDSDVARGLQAGADAYLTKPFDPLELEETVMALLELGPEQRHERRARKLG